MATPCLLAALTESDLGLAVKVYDRERCYEEDEAYEEDAGKVHEGWIVQ